MGTPHRCPRRGFSEKLRAARSRGVVLWEWGAGGKLGLRDPPSADWYDETSFRASGGSCQSTFER